MKLEIESNYHDDRRITKFPKISKYFVISNWLKFYGLFFINSQHLLYLEDAGTILDDVGAILPTGRYNYCPNIKLQPQAATQHPRRQLITTAFGSGE